MNLDKINNADPESVAKAAFAIVDRLQLYPSHIQPLAAAAVFVIVNEVLKLNEQDTFTTAKNLMSTKEGRRPEFAAIKDYTKYELK